LYSKFTEVYIFIDHKNNKHIYGYALSTRRIPIKVIRKQGNRE